MKCSCLTKGYAEGDYVLPPLPYEENALEPFISAETLRLHHDKHHAAYVAGANKAAETLMKAAQGKLESEVIPAATQDLAFNLGGHILHSLYWGNLSPEKQEPPKGKLLEAINRDYGSLDGFTKIFSTAALSVKGSGWGILGFDLASRKLIICGVNNHQNMLVPGCRPLLACDVWEHAYYLDWQNNRKGYIDAFMERINWKSVENRYEDCCHEC